MPFELELIGYAKIPFGAHGWMFALSDTQM